MCKQNIVDARLKKTPESLLRVVSNVNTESVFNPLYVVIKHTTGIPSFIHTPYVHHAPTITPPAAHRRPTTHPLPAHDAPTTTLPPAHNPPTTSPQPTHHQSTTSPLEAHHQTTTSPQSHHKPRPTANRISNHHTCSPRRKYATWIHRRHSGTDSIPPAL